MTKSRSEKQEARILAVRQCTSISRMLNCERYGCSKMGFTWVA